MEDKDLYREINDLETKKGDLEYTVLQLEKEEREKGEKIRSLEKNCNSKQKKVEELDASIKQKQDALVLETERLRQVRSELAKARRERNDYIQESKSIVNKAKAEAEKLMQQTLRDAEERAIAKTIQIEENAKRRLEWVNRMIKAASDYRKALYKVEEANARYIAVGSLMISVFGEKVKDIADSICQTVGSSRIRVTIPSDTSLAFWKACEETNFKEDS